MCYFYFQANFLGAKREYPILPEITSERCDTLRQGPSGIILVLAESGEFVLSHQNKKCPEIEKLPCASKRSMDGVEECKAAVKIWIEEKKPFKVAQLEASCQVQCTMALSY